MIFKRGHFSNSAIEESVINESLNSVRSFSADTDSSIPTVFLSHKHDDLRDQKELRGFMGKLRNLGVKVYIDSMDNKMPNHTSGETAKRIKDVIKYCNKFILLATESAIESYWCNWELGIGDTHKYSEHIAILPIKDIGTFDSEYKGNEYLQIYPRIDYEDGTKIYRDTKERVQAGYYVATPPNKENVRTITPLRRWLNS